MTRKSQPRKSKSQPKSKPQTVKLQVTRPKPESPQQKRRRDNLRKKVRAGSEGFKYPLTKIGLEGPLEKIGYKGPWTRRFP